MKKILSCFVILFCFNIITIAQIDKSVNPNKTNVAVSDLNANYSFPYKDKSVTIEHKKLNYTPLGINLSERKVLFEESTNTGCGPCASSNPALTSYLHTMGDKIVAVKFHSWWPSASDPMYAINAVQNKSFINYMGVSSVPTLEVDGILHDIWPFSNTAFNNAYNNRMAVAPLAFISITDERIAEDSIKSRITIVVEKDMPAVNTRLRVLAVEEKIVYSSAPGSNGEKVFEHVFRKAYPDPTGIGFNYASGTYQLIYTYKIEDAWQDTMIYTVAWLQNDLTKEIINCAKGEYVAEVLAAPQLLLPENNAASIPFSTELTWGKIINADYYSLQIAEDENFSINVIKEDSLTVETYKLNRLKESTKYYWKVKAFNSGLVSNFSETYNFITQLKKPTNLLGGSFCGSICLEWKDNSEKEKNYIIERAVGTDTTLLNYEIIAILKENDTIYYDQAVQVDTVYAYRIMAKNDSTASLYSSVVYAITTVGIEEENNKNLSFNLLQNYPNPFNPSTTILFSLAKKVFVTLKIYDELGKEAAVLINEELNAGEYQKQWNAFNLSSGVYFYKLQAGSFVETKKLLLLK
ncbi:MAG: T9SS type A sorting domain-containing protein [bacterium]